MTRLVCQRCSDGSPIVCSSQPARRIIADSWRRSRLSGLSPSSTFNALKADDYDTSSRLLRAAGPVLNTMAAALDGWDYCVVLADRDARIVATRWGCARVRSMFELLGEALHGTIFREETTGTNSIATTYELRQAVAVHRDEHFLAQLHGLSCYGHPIIYPHAWRPELRRELRAGRDRPTLAIGRDILVANAAAIELLDAPDHALIRDIATSCTGEATQAAQVTLSKNRKADIVCRTLTPSVGAVLTINNVKRPTPHVLSRPLREPTHGVLICGEPGAGHTTAIQKAAASTSLRIHHAAHCPAQSAAEWLSDVRQSASESGVVAVESVHLLSAHTSQSLTGILNSFTGTVILSTIMPPDELILQTRQLISRCTEQIQLTP